MVNITEMGVSPTPVGCLFEDPDECKPNQMEDDVSGAVIIAISVLSFFWYCFVLVNIFRLTKKIPTFVIFFSQGIGDLGYLLNSMWLGVDIIIGESSLVKNTKLYSVMMNVFSRPVLFHFLFIAVVRFLLAWFPNTFKQYFTRKILVTMCCLIWMSVCVEVAVLHVIWPTKAYVNQNLYSYGFYSQDIDTYTESFYIIYLNAVNVMIGVTTLLCYLSSIWELRKSTIRKSREGKLLGYCFTDCLIVFILYALKSVLYMKIRESNKRLQLFVQVAYTCTYAISSILLPVFSADLWHKMFRNKSSPISKTVRQQSFSSATKTGRTGVAVMILHTSGAYNHSIPVLGAERY